MCTAAALVGSCAPTPLYSYMCSHTRHDNGDMARHYAMLDRQSVPDELCMGVVTLHILLLQHDASQIICGKMNNAFAQQCQSHTAMEIC